jgi:hypothetical protein
VLIHELGHQLTAPDARLLPFWLNEGLAEYIALPRYNNGAFLDSPRDMLQRLGERFDYYEHLPARAFDPLAPAGSRHGHTRDWLLPLPQLFDPQLATNAPSLARTHQIYLTSLVVVWYFMHLDGDGQARRIRAYFEELAEAQEYFATDGAAGRLPAEATPESTWHRNGLRTILAEHLFAGQSPEDLQKDLVASFARAGLQVEFP